MNKLFRCLIVLLAFSFSSCNEYEYTDIKVRMINNQNNSWVYMWVYYLEDKPAYLQSGQSRTFDMVFTFTEDNPQTTIMVVCDDMGKTTSTSFIVNAESPPVINAYYNSDGIITIL